MKLQLISFKLCPYVQRSVITLLYKKAPYDVTYIDLENPPEWFDKISPLGQVPVLVVDEKTAIFESAVINEFVDETMGERLLHKDPVKRAFERSWIAYGSELLSSMYGMTVSSSEDELIALKKEFFESLARLENIIDPGGPYFRGKEFSLVDTSYAPMFKRILLSEKLMEEPAWREMPKVLKWAWSLMEVPAVKNSTVPEFDELYLEYCRANGSLLY